MLGISWYFICGVLVAAAATVSDISSTEIEKTNNAELTLETVLGFNSTDNADNINFLNKVQNVIGNIKSVIERKSSKRRTADTDNIETFTDFIQRLFKKLEKFDDSNLKYFVTVFNDEIRNYHYRGCKFHELLENYGLRIYLSRILSEIQMQPESVIRSKLEEIADKMKKKKYKRHEHNLVDVINSVYRSDSIEKFRSFLSRIDAKRMKARKVDLHKIIKEGLRSIVFDYYSQLNYNVRMTLKSQVNEFWNNSLKSQSYPFMAIDDKVDTRIVFPTNSNKTFKHDIIKNLMIDETLKPILLNKTYKHQTIPTKLTFKTLYPDLLPKWTQHNLFDDRREHSRRSFVHRQKAAARRSINKLEPIKAMNLNNKFNATVMGKFEKTTEPGVFKYKAPEKVSSLYLRKVTHENEKIHDTTDSKVINSNKELEIHTNTSSKPPTVSSSDSSSSEMTKDSMNSDGGMSIERYGEVTSTMFHRKSYTYFNSTVNSTLTALNSKTQSQSTPIVPLILNTMINNNNKITAPNHKEKPDDKNKVTEKIGTSKEKQKETAVQKRYHVRSRVADSQFDNINENRGTFEITNQTVQNNNNNTAKKVKDLLNDLNKEDNVTYNNGLVSPKSTSQRNENKDSIYIQRSVQTSNDPLVDPKQDKLRNFEETTKNSISSTSNKAVISKTKYKEIGFKINSDVPTIEGQKQDNDPTGKATDNKDNKNDVDFRSIIQDYENDINDYTHKTSKHIVETTKVTLNLDSIVTKIDVKTESAATAKNITTIQSPLETSKITIISPSIFPPRSSRITFKHIAPAYNINQNKYLLQTTSAPGVFNANFIKHLMKTTASTTKTTKRTTTRESKIMGRNFNDDGVIVDSFEGVNKGLDDPAFMGGYQDDYDSSKGSYHD